MHAAGNDLMVTNADSLTVLITAATDFRGGPFPGGDPVARCEAVRAKAQEHSPEQVLTRQLAAYQPLYRTMSLHLGRANDPQATLPTDERIRRMGAGSDDLGLQELYSNSRAIS